MTIKKRNTRYGCIENSLNITEGRSGLIKLDFTCFHYKTYATGYCPSASHISALISYLLEENAYELNHKTKENLLNALKVFRIVSVRYSTPSQIGARFIKYENAILAEHLPAYAYMAMRSPLERFKPSGLPNLNVEYNQTEFAFFVVSIPRPAALILA